MAIGTRGKREIQAEIEALRRRVVELEEHHGQWRATEQALRQSEDRYRRLLESVTDYVYTVVVHDGVPISTSHGPNCVAVTGYTAEEYRQNPLLWLSMVPDEDRQAVIDHARCILSGEEAGPIEHRIIHKDGSVRFVRNTPVVRRDASGALVAYDGIIIDITERKRAEELITRLSLHDGLTGLPNRALYMDRLRQTLGQAGRQGEKVAVYFIDLDYFKNVNDAFGHEVGDAVLAVVAKRLVDCVRHTDTVARLGGDEFVALTPAIGDGRNAAAIAEKMVEAMRQPFHVQGHACQLGASVGVALFPDDADKAGALLRLADAAMYAAKEAGRNGWRMSGSLAAQSQSATSE
jgi:diguanylate cyclase (GGDEF)-like protein/PAS domain S-box-containing protein